MLWFMAYRLSLRSLVYGLWSTASGQWPPVHLPPRPGHGAVHGGRAAGGLPWGRRLWSTALSPVVYGLWPTAYGLWSMVYGGRAAGGLPCRRPTAAACRLWSMVYELWAIVYGPWSMVYGLWSSACEQAAGAGEGPQAACAGMAQAVHRP